ncbi:MAG: hypothetical protein IJL89_04240, partial [Firmicutes bacterium]|nr:hypothetical protein [Bacillota bacterium]
MNKKIKRLVSSVLAATIAFASITVNIPVLSKVGGVVDVYAGDVATGTYSLNFSDAFSAENLTVGESSVAVSDSNNIINYTPAANSQSTYHSTGYGLAIKSADPITVQVSGDANISFQVSKWADENGYFNVTNSNGDDLGTLSSYNATDKAYNTFQYRGEETTLTFSYSGGTSYVVSITAEWLGTVTTDTEITAGEYSLDFSTKYSGTASQSYVTGSVSSVKDVITYAPSNNSSKYWGSTYGLYMASGEKVTVQVIGDANISFVVSKYSDANSEFTVTNSNGTNLGTVSAYNATDLA